MRYFGFLFFLLMGVMGCDEREVARVNHALTHATPLSCLKLNTIGLEPAFKEVLFLEYAFDDACPWTLDVRYKRDIVCNSSYNAVSKNLGKFPRSFLKLEVREGMKVVYSYYIDLYDNVDKSDLQRGIKRLKKDLLSR